MNITDIANFISPIVRLLVSFYVYVKATNTTASLFGVQRAIMVIWCFLWALPYALGLLWIPPLVIRFVTCAAAIIFIWVLTKSKFETVVSAFLFSYVISLSLLYIATIIVGVVFGLLMDNVSSHNITISDNDPIFAVIIACTVAVLFLMVYLLFRIRRFKNGFPFLFQKHAVVFSLIISGIVIVLASTVSDPRELHSYTYFLFSLVVGTIIIGAGIIIWVRRGIREFYRKKMVARSVEMLEKELAEKDENIQRLTEQNDSMRVANHKIAHRLSALERSVAKLVLTEGDSDGLSIISDDIMRLSREYQNEIGRINTKPHLPTTKISMIDDIFEHFAVRCMENDIVFGLNVIGSIPYMTEHIIKQNKLETMIGDHLQNALVAVNAGSNTFRSILVKLGLMGDFYELSVLDGGIPFELDTLVKLGTERVTTHPDDGGSGIGFMTTFETMREYGASMIIDETESSGTTFSKSVTIRFDKANDYIIRTPRADELRTLCTGKDVPEGFVTIQDQRAAYLK